MQYFIFFFFCHGEFLTGDIFETHHLGKLSTKDRFIKSKCFFSITVEVYPGI